MGRLCRLFKFILKNHKENTLATKVPIEGDLNQVDTNTWTTVLNIFKNGWIEAFKGIVDDDIDFKEVRETAKQEREKD